MRYSEFIISIKNVQNLKTRFVFEMYGPYQITVFNKIVFIFNFTNVSENFVPIGPLVTEIQNIGENILSIFL